MQKMYPCFSLHLLDLCVCGSSVRRRQTETRIDFLHCNEQQVSWQCRCCAVKHGIGSRFKGGGCVQHFGHGAKQNCPHLSDLPSGWDARTSFGAGPLACAFCKPQNDIPNDHQNNKEISLPPELKDAKGNGSTAKLFKAPILVVPPKPSIQNYLNQCTLLSEKFFCYRHCIDITSIYCFCEKEQLEQRLWKYQCVQKPELGIEARYHERVNISFNHKPLSPSMTISVIWPEFIFTEV